LGHLTRLLGPDIDKWTLGAFHHATIFHPLSPALKPELREKFDVGKLGRGGDSYTRWTGVPISEQTSTSGWAIRGAIGRAIRWWSRRPISPTKPPSEDPAKIYI
jgi:hypothetical protein